MGLLTAIIANGNCFVMTFIELINFHDMSFVQRFLAYEVAISLVIATSVRQVSSFGRLLYMDQLRNLRV